MRHGYVSGRIAEGDRDTYPAGHPVTWGLISAEPYPHPVFDPTERARPNGLTRAEIQVAIDRINGAAQ